MTASAMEQALKAIWIAFGPRARPPEALHNRSRDAEHNRFGQTELNDADQDKKEIHRKRGENHRQPDLQARSQDGNEKITPELKRVRRTGNAISCAASPNVPEARISAI